MPEGRDVVAVVSGSASVMILLFGLVLGLAVVGAGQQRTEKPVLHGKHWVAITGKPLAATAGATVFTRGGNAVDAACAMLAAVCTMHDSLGWGGETRPAEGL